MDIHAVQYGLENMGFTVPVTGVWDIATRVAVKNFQSNNNLTPDGVLGPLTIAKLFPLAAPANLQINATTLADRARQYALSQNGVREATGKNDGPKVEMYLASVGLSKGYSWCMAFVHWCYDMAAGDLKIVNPLKRTGGCMDQYYYMLGLNKVYHEPQINDIFILNLGHGKGHTGIVLTVNNDGTINNCEGNTNDNGSANGNGVYDDRVRRVASVYGFIRV